MLAMCMALNDFAGNVGKGAWTTGVVHIYPQIVVYIIHLIRTIRSVHEGGLYGKLTATPADFTVSPGDNRTPRTR